MRRVFNHQDEGMWPAMAADTRILNKIRNVLLVGWVVVLLIAAGFVVAGMVAAPNAAAHDLTCQMARDMAHHPNAYCQRVSPNAIDLYFPWRTCRERVAYTSHGSWPWYEHKGTVAYCPSWH